MIDDQVKTPPTKETTDQALAAAAAVGVALAQEQARQMAVAAAVSVALLLQATAPEASEPWRGSEASEPWRGSEASEPWRGSGAALSPWQIIMRSNQLAKKSRGSLR